MAAFRPLDRRSVWGPAAIAVLLLFGPGMAHLAHLSVEQHRLTRQLDALKAEQARLTAEQERLQSDPTYVEGLVRTTFKYAKPGELVIPLDDDSSRRSTH